MATEDKRRVCSYFAVKKTKIEMENGTSIASQAHLTVQLSIFMPDLNVSNTNAERKICINLKKPSSNFT